ncbi:helix-turn-helix transcriptional regulator [Atopobiaceae bacterium 24-176]
MRRKSSIRALRKARGLGRFRAAEAAGVPKNTLDGWEQYGIPGQVETACRIARALGCSVEELFADDIFAEGVA